MKKGIVSTTLLLMLFVSMFNSSTLVSGVPVITGSYHVPEDLLYMEPDFYCDLNNDGKVDIKDVSIATKAWGSHGPDFEWPGQEPSENWDKRADINKDNQVDIRDVAAVARRFGLIEDPPIAYSTNFEFDPSADAAETNWIFYYVKVRVYVPTELSEQEFYLTGYVFWVVGHIKLDDSSIEGADSSDVNISLGTVYGGWHLLEFEYADSYGMDGILNFQVATLTGQCARLVRFCIYVPNHSENEYKYSVKTHTWCPIWDDYFLKGYANDYIDALSVDSTQWHDWEWSCHPYETIYAWGDGFCYPLGKLPKQEWYDICFTFGEIWTGGKLDFQVVSWERQRDRIGNPRFRALASLYLADYWTTTINSAGLYGGSKWKVDEDPQFSERYFEARENIDASYNDGTVWYNTGVEIGLGLGWAEWALLPGTEDDVGITLNLTATHFESNLRDHGDMGFFCSLYLSDITLDICSFPNLEIKGIEYQEHDSFVKPDLTAAIDFTGTVMLFVFGKLENPIGSLFGLGVKGFATAVNYMEGQRVSRFDEELSQPHYYQVTRTYVLTTPRTPHEGEITSKSDIIFFKLNPTAGKRCGLTTVELRATLGVFQQTLLEPGAITWVGPIGEITIRIAIPWFLRG